MNPPSTHRPPTSLPSFKPLVRSRTQVFAYKEPALHRSQNIVINTQRDTGGLPRDLNNVEIGNSDLSKITPTSIEIDSDQTEVLTLPQSDASPPARPILPSKSSSGLTLRQRRFSKSLQSLSREFNFNGGESSRNRHKTFRKWQHRDSYMEIDSDPDESPEDFQVVVAVIATVTAKPVLTPLVISKQSTHLKHSDYPEMPTNISTIPTANFPEVSTSISTLPAVYGQDGSVSADPEALDDGPMENISISAEHKAPESPLSKSSFASSADLGLNRSGGSSSIVPSLSGSNDPSSDSSCGLSFTGGSTPSTAFTVKSLVMNSCLPLSIQPDKYSFRSYPEPVRSPIRATNLTSEIPRRDSEGILPKTSTRLKRSGTLPSRKFTKDSLPATGNPICPWEAEEGQEFHPFMKTTTVDQSQSTTTDCNKSISSRNKHRPLKEKIGATSFFRKLAHKISTPTKGFNRSDSPVPR